MSMWGIYNIQRRRVSCRESDEGRWHRMIIHYLAVSKPPSMRLAGPWARYLGGDDDTNGSCTVCAIAAFVCGVVRVLVLCCAVWWWRHCANFVQNCVDKTYCLQKQDIVHSLKTGSVSRDFKTFIFFMNGTHLISRLKTNFYFVSLSTIIDRKVRKVSVNHFFLTFLRACAKLCVRCCSKTFLGFCCWKTVVSILFVQTRISFPKMRTVLNFER